MSNSFYITTPIYYPNGEPHLGHIYTTLCADVLARRHRLVGDDTYFLTGTDEHGIKMVKTAAAENVSPQELADRNAKVFKDAFAQLKVTNDDFIRTSEPRHKTAVQEIVKKMVATGDFYLGSYEGWYDEGQEEFVTETEAKANEFKSIISGRPLVRYKEPTYFFKLSKYVEQVYAAIESDKLLVRPENRKNEVLSKLKGWTADLSISRSSLKWGIPIPHDPEHVLYVWIDALSNYVTALGYPSGDGSAGASPSTDLFSKFWPADVHLIGKEILWFHAVYWPAMLISLGLPLPKQIFAHGWWTADGKKMSKTMGNFIDLSRVQQLAETYSLDALRFYLLRAAPFGSDLDFGEADFHKSFNELANVLGNCLNRTLKMVGKYRDGVLGPVSHAPSELDQSLIAAIDRLPAALDAAYAKLELQQAVLLPLDLARQTNGYIDATAPFSLAKDPAKAAQLDTVLHLSVQAMYRALIGLIPVLPEKALEGIRQLGIDPATAGKDPKKLWDHLPLGHRVGEGSPLFPRVEAQ